MPQRWLKVTVRSPSDEHAGLLAEGLLACGGTAVEEVGGQLVTYVALDDEAAVVLERLRKCLQQATGAEPVQLEGEDVPEQDWLALWRAGLGPRRVGGRVIVAPTWSEVADGPDDLIIRIDPQMAFGTGEHATTRGVLRLMQQVVEPGARLLDVGTGSAILAIAGALLGARHVLAVESDDDAMENAGENIERNGVSDRVTLQCAFVDDAFLAAHGAAAFDGILANVLSSVLRPLLPAFHASLRPDGWVILSGILREEAADVRASAHAAGFSIAAEDAEEQWWSVLCRR